MDGYKMTVLAVVQARMGSTRLPGKSLMPLAGLALLGWTVRAARETAGIDKTVVATSSGADDDAIAAWCAREKITCYRGSETDVLDRFAMVANAVSPDAIVRLTADCPFLDPVVVGQIVRLFLNSRDVDYVSNVSPPSWPDGLDAEIFSTKALLHAAAEATAREDREHVTAYIRRNAYRFKSKNINCPIPGLSGERWTVDTLDDFHFAEALTRHINPNVAAKHTDILDVLARNPDIRKISAEVTRRKPVDNDMALYLPGDFETSNQLLVRAEKVIPLGAQTFSKSKIQYPEKHAPLFLSHGAGGRVYDVDGNEYVDLVGGLLPNVLGYCDADVDNAIRDQLNQGISFSLSTELETKLAEMLVSLIPSAEQVRFFKNGTDATSAAVRLSRGVTGRDRIIVCGYHGWQDWYIGSTTRNRGVPGVVQGLTHKVPYNDVAAVAECLRKHPDEVAALVMEPVVNVAPMDGYFDELKALLHKNGCLLVFDEVVTGFRFSEGGAQTVFGVTPDLSAFGKAMANGMPISALVGRADLMSEMSDVFISGTFGGEALSLAAAIATVEKISSENVIKFLWDNGGSLADEVQTLIIKHALGDVIGLTGYPVWKILAFKGHKNASANQLKTLFVIEMIKHRVLVNASHNLCFAHTSEDFAHVIAAYDATLSKFAEALRCADFSDFLPCPVIEPVFSVRTTS